MRIGGLEKSSLLDYPGKISCIVYTVGCNFRCPYCHNPELVDETIDQEISSEHLLDFLKTRQGLLDGVVITGGEPTMHQDLPELIKSIKDLGFLVKLDSNGTNPAMLEQLIKDRLVDYLAMDIKSPLSKYSQTVARPTDIDAIKRSIELIMSQAVEYEFRTTVIKTMLTPEDFDEIAKLIRGAKRYYLQRFEPIKILNPQFRQKTTYSDSELESIREKLAKHVECCGVR